jgi:hypothetical protein
LEAGEDFGVGGIVGILLLGDVLERLEDEGFEGEVLLGGEVGELMFKIGGELDGEHGVDSWGWLGGCADDGALIISDDLDGFGVDGGAWGWGWLARQVGSRRCRSCGICSWLGWRG